jgi:hypothetical protein
LGGEIARFRKQSSLSQVKYDWAAPKRPNSGSGSVGIANPYFIQREFTTLESQTGGGDSG